MRPRGPSLGAGIAVARPAGGLGYAWGDSSIIESLDLTDPDINSIVSGSNDPVRIKYQALTGTLGFSLKL